MKKVQSEINYWFFEKTSEVHEGHELWYIRCLPTATHKVVWCRGYQDDNSGSIIITDDTMHGFHQQLIEERFRETLRKELLENQKKRLEDIEIRYSTAENIKIHVGDDNNPQYLSFDYVFNGKNCHYGLFLHDNNKKISAAIIDYFISQNKVVDTVRDYDDSEELDIE